MTREIQSYIERHIEMHSRAESESHMGFIYCIPVCRIQYGGKS